MSRIFLYAHGGSGNHGCEAIVRSTVELLQKLPAEELVLISSAPEEDKAYGIDALCTVERDKRPLSQGIPGLFEGVSLPEAAA